MNNHNMVGLEDNTMGLIDSYANQYIVRQHLTKLKIFIAFPFDKGTERII